MPKQLSALECAKFVFGRGSALDPARGAYSAPPDSLPCLSGTLLVRGKESGETGGTRVKGKGREGKGADERRTGALAQIPGSTPAWDRPAIVEQ